MGLSCRDSGWEGNIAVGASDVHDVGFLDDDHDLLLAVGVALDLAGEVSLVGIAASVVVDLLNDENDSVLRDISFEVGARLE